MTSLLYFSYGSNMSTPRLMNRVHSAKSVSVARLEKHRLRFHKRSKKGSGKCDIEFTDDAEHFVYGVVYRLLTTEKQKLDAIEELGQGYNEKTVSLVGIHGELFDAVTYYATDIDSSLKPYHWYKEHVIRGAKEHRLPPEYIRTIEGVESLLGPDQKTHDKELSIYY